VKRSRRRSRHDLLTGVARDASAGGRFVFLETVGGAAVQTQSLSLASVDRGRILVWLAVVVGVALIVLAVVYWVEPAKSLPTWIPGHEAGSNHHHVKHGIAAFVVALGCFIFAWFQTGPATTSAQR